MLNSHQGELFPFILKFNEIADSFRKKLNITILYQITASAIINNTPWAKLAIEGNTRQAMTKRL